MAASTLAHINMSSDIIRAIVELYVFPLIRVQCVGTAGCDVWVYVCVGSRVVRVCCLLHCQPRNSHPTSSHRTPLGIPKPCMTGISWLCSAAEANGSAWNSAAWSWMLCGSAAVLACTVKLPA